MGQLKTQTDYLGVALAALIALFCAMPQATLLPALDRDEARFAQASRQMIETGDYIDIRFQDDARHKKPVGIHWMQVASVRATGALDHIQAYRIPSLLGVMLAAGGLVWGMGGLVTRQQARVAGVLFAASLTLGIEGGIAKTDAMLTGLTVISLLCIVRMFMSVRGGAPVTSKNTWLFWGALGLATLIKGPVAPMLCGLAFIVLAIPNQRLWYKHTFHVPAMILFLLIILPWAMLITAKTDGQFWQTAIGGDLAPKLAGGHERHGGPFGLHTLIMPLGLWPASVMVMGIIFGVWRARKQPLVWALLAISVPGLLMFEIMPTKLAHYGLPTYAGFVALGVVCWSHVGHRLRRGGAAVLTLLGGVVVSAVMIYAARQLGGDAVSAYVFTAFVMVISIWAAWTMATKGLEKSILSLVAAGFIVHLSLTVIAVQASDLWLAPQVKRALYDAGWSGGTAVASSGYSEPSLVFALGTVTHLAAKPTDVCATRFVVADVNHLPAIEAACPGYTVASTVWGQNYSRGQDMTLVILRFDNE